MPSIQNAYLDCDRGTWLEKVCFQNAKEPNLCFTAIKHDKQAFLPVMQMKAWMG